LATELIRHDSIQTTEAKAKSVQAMVERLITLARRGDLHSRRMAARDIYDPAILQKLFDEVGPRMQERAGGYTRIYKLGLRQGDAAPMAKIEIVE
jgi:large subunit ribosomal protein L17